jgi:hypothetical protein
MMKTTKVLNMHYSENLNMDLSQLYIHYLCQFQGFSLILHILKVIKKFKKLNLKSSLSPVFAAQIRPVFLAP